MRQCELTQASPARDNQAFFTVMGCSDLWKELRKHMYKGKKKNNYEKWNGTGDVAAKYGYRIFMEERAHLEYTSSGINDATLRGDLWTISFILDSPNFSPHLDYKIKLLEISARHGHFHVMEYLMRRFPNLQSRDHISASVMNNAAAGGHLEIVKYLDKIGAKCTVVAVDAAAENGHFDVVEWLNLHRTEGCSSNAMDAACSTGNLKIVKYLHHKADGDCTRIAPIKAASSGHLDVVSWIHRNVTLEWDEVVMDSAARSGNYGVVVWLHNNREEGCSTAAMDFAAQNGHLDVVKFLHENRTEGCTTMAMNSAAENGRLQVVKWLHLNRTEGCTFVAINRAIENGHLEMLEFLHKVRGEKPNENAMDIASERGHLEVVEYLHHHCTNLVCTEFATNWAAGNGHLDVLKFLCFTRREKPGNNAMFYACRNGHYEVVVFLFAVLGVSFCNDAMSAACENDHLDVAKFLRTKEAPINYDYTLPRVAEKGHLEMVKFLYNTGLEHRTVIRPLSHTKSRASAWNLNVRVFLGEQSVKASVLSFCTTYWKLYIIEYAAKDALEKAESLASADDAEILSVRNFHLELAARCKTMWDSCVLNYIKWCEN